MPPWRRSTGGRRPPPRRWRRPGSPQRGGYHCTCAPKPTPWTSRARGTRPPQSPLPWTARAPSRWRQGQRDVWGLGSHWPRCPRAPRGRGRSRRRRSWPRPSGCLQTLWQSPIPAPPPGSSRWAAGGAAIRPPRSAPPFLPVGGAPTRASSYRCPFPTPRRRSGLRARLAAPWPRTPSWSRPRRAGRAPRRRAQTPPRGARRAPSRSARASAAEGAHCRGPCTTPVAPPP